jgi:4-hydroxymandelate oxidase
MRPTLDALESLARERLPANVYDYYAGGAADERTLGENRAAFARVSLRPRIARAGAPCDLATTVLGQRLAFPIAVAPTALQGLAHPSGEVATARACGALGTALGVAMMASASIEEVTAATEGPAWMQIYLLADRGLTRALVDRAVAAGACALILTVDATVTGRRRRSRVSRVTLPPSIRFGNLDGLAAEPLPLGGGSLAAGFASLVDPSATWRDVGWLRSLSALPLVVKGVLTAEDARLAAAAGADAVVVSNHGGRILDYASTTLDALPEVVAALGARAEVWLDGGVRSGADVAKALALGARLVLVGRPVLWGLATGGEAGVGDVLTSLRDELSDVLDGLGCRSPGELCLDHVQTNC